MLLIKAFNLLIFLKEIDLNVSYTYVIFFLFSVMSTFIYETDIFMKTTFII